MKLYLVRCLTLLAVAFLPTTDAQDVAQAATKKQKAASGELYEKIAQMDRAVFDAFNAHDVERLVSMFTEDLEFYDDSSGLETYAQMKDGFEKMFKNVPDLRRDLVPGTLEVYPLPGYGAIEVGEHRFCHYENGKPDCGVTKFSMVWRQIGDTWKLSRVLSYGH